MVRALLIGGLVACGPTPQPEVWIDQYQEVDAPGAKGARIALGDVELGSSAEITIKAKDRFSIGDLREGDELPFVVEGKLFTAKVIDYEDNMVVDRARVRVDPGPPKQDSILRITEGGTLATPTGITIKIGKIDGMLVNDVTIETKSSNVAPRPAGITPEAIGFEVDGVPHAISFLGLGLPDGPADTIYLRVRSTVGG